MNIQLYFVGVAVAGLVFPEIPARAVVPRAHQCEIVIESVDPRSRTLYARGIGRHPGTLNLRWTQGLRIRTDNGWVQPCSLLAGQKAVIRHREPFFGPWRLTKLELIP